VLASTFRDYSIPDAEMERSAGKKLRLREEKLRDIRPRRGPDCVIRIIALCRNERLQKRARARAYEEMRLLKASAAA